MVDRKVLVVNRDPVLVEVLRRELTPRGYRIVSTVDAGGGLKTVLDDEFPDLVILDIMMPRMEGIEICLRLREWSQVPVIMLSTWGTGRNMVRGLDLASESYLTEPFAVTQLAARIEAVFYRNRAAIRPFSDVGLEIS